MSAFGGRLLTTSAFTGDQGIVTVRPGVKDGAALDKPGKVRAVKSEATPRCPR